MSPLCVGILPCLLYSYLLWYLWSLNTACLKLNLCVRDYFRLFPTYSTKIIIGTVISIKKKMPTGMGKSRPTQYTSRGTKTNQRPIKRHSKTNNKNVHRILLFILTLDDTCHTWLITFVRTRKNLNRSQFQKIHLYDWLGRELVLQASPFSLPIRGTVIPFPNHDQKLLQCLIDFVFIIMRNLGLLMQKSILSCFSRRKIRWLQR